MADPQYMGYVDADTSNSLIPPSKWLPNRIVKITDNPWQQYNALRAWDKDGVGGIRNVKLEKITTKIVKIEHVED
jgi:hypothetical protein